MKKLRTVTEHQLESLNLAYRLLRTARVRLEEGGCKRLAADVQALRKRAEGALRHAKRASKPN